jgi:hypothetical protein
MRFFSLVPFLGKEFLQLDLRFCCHNPVVYGWIMVHSWVSTYVVQAARGSGFWVGGAKYQGSYAVIDEGSRTHNARFQGDHQVAVI